MPFYVTKYYILLTAPNAFYILWWGLMSTPNTAGTAGIDACGVSKPLVDEGHMTGFGRDTLKQEACGLKIHR
jgi:hypothetical protein